ncbi:DNA adenine methylase [Dysgonomonas sp. 25]|uniref:DNA adenine methylase n=1 Tax=Dysgonomonas sp. 25 TaxID=2302933 RepID=UPI001C887EAD|nr:DNA adenine methylase [Dysgonomonas sp. 25]
MKWAGGKRQLIPEIVKHLPENIMDINYCEPFIGGGALFFYLRPSNAIISDNNKELINVYQVIKYNINELIEALKEHEATPEYFHELRASDRSPSYNELSDVKKASRIIFLNKTCYNGLYRVNRLGQFNTSFGWYKNPVILDEKRLNAINYYLNNNNIEILSYDYTLILEKIDNNTFVYLDPPYHPISKTSNFTAYTGEGWGEDEQIKLKEECDLLTKRGIKFLLSNSGSRFIYELYKGYNIHTVKARRAINSNSKKRGEVVELLINNYDK